jgi:S-adenosylmethionine:tRNA ribosyltransferase-isomerase
MKAATSPRNVARMMVVRNQTIEHSSIENLAAYLESGDVVVVNDAATLPCSLSGRTSGGSEIEIRLLSPLSEGVWESVAFGTGDWKTPTEIREPPAALAPGDSLNFAGARATVVHVSKTSERLLTLRFDLSPERFWRFIYREGRPVQYSYMSTELELWSVQNIYSSRPWAIEMPSAGHAITWRLLLSLLEKGIRVVRLTHAAGISSTGDSRVDRMLPLDERFEIPPETLAAIERTKSEGHRVIAVGTSVVRALESNALGIAHTTSLRIGPGHRLRLVDALLTGTHDATESHYHLLSAFVSRDVLERVGAELENNGYLTHEFGDLCLVFDQGQLSRGGDGAAVDTRCCVEASGL